MSLHPVPSSFPESFALARSASPGANLSSCRPFPSSVRELLLSEGTGLPLWRLPGAPPGQEGRGAAVGTDRAEPGCLLGSEGDQDPSGTEPGRDPATELAARLLGRPAPGDPVPRGI